VAFVHIASLVLLSLVVSFCVCLLDVSGSVVLFIFCLFLSGVCLNGGCGLRGTHSGLSQLVSDWSTVALFFIGCVCSLCLCFFRCCCFVFFVALLLLWVWVLRNVDCVVVVFGVCFIGEFVLFLFLSV